MRLREYLSESQILYHGSPTSNLTKINTRRGKDNLGAYFTDNPELAKTFGNNIYKVKIDFGKMLDMSSWKPLHADEDFIRSVPVLKKSELDEYLEFDYYGHDSPYHALEKLDSKYNIVPRLKKRGYDGIIFNEDHFGKVGKVYVIFNSKKIKIVT